MEGAPDPVAEAFLKKLEISKRAQLIRSRLAQASSKIQPAATVDPPPAPSPAAPAATSSDSLLADALRVEVRAGKRKAAVADLEQPSAPTEKTRWSGADATGREQGTQLGDRAEGERKPGLWEVMLNPPVPQQHPASPRTALPQGMTYGYPPSSAGSSSYHNYRGSPGGGAYDSYEAYRPHLPASPSFYASPDPNASSFAAPFSTQTRSTPVTSSMRGQAAGLAAASPKRLAVGVNEAGLRVPSSGGRYPGSSGSFGRSPSSTFTRPPATAAAANHSYAQGLTTSPIINSSPKISSARTSIPSGAPVVRPSPSSAGTARTVIHPSPLGAPVPSQYPPGFGPPAHLPSRLQQHRQRLGGVGSPGSPGSPRADGSPSGLPMPSLVRGHRRTVSSTLSAVVNFQNAQRSSPQAKGPVEEYLTHLASPGRSPRKRRRSPPPSAPAQLGKPTNLADISAASALTAMLTSTGSASSLRGSTEPSETGASSIHPLPARAKSTTPPSTTRRSSKTGAPGEDDAAGMLMFFHHSPSPAKPRSTPRPRDVSGAGPPPPAASARGRVLLFGEDDPGTGSSGGFGASSKSNVGSSGTSHAAGPSQEAGPSSQPLTRQQRVSPRKTRPSGGISVSPDKKPSGSRGHSTGGESGKENRVGPGGDGDPDSSSSSLFSLPEDRTGTLPHAEPSASLASPSALTAATSLASSHPGVSPPSPSTGLLTPAPSSLPLFISPARAPSTPGITFPPPSASTHASPGRPPPGTAVRAGLNPTLAPSSVVQAGATPSWPDFGYLSGSPLVSTRKQALESVAERKPTSVPLDAAQLGGVA